MSAKGNPYDNTKAESFFKTLKREEVYLNSTSTRRLQTPRPSLAASSTTYTISSACTPASAIHRRPRSKPFTPPPRSTRHQWPGGVGMFLCLLHRMRDMVVKEACAFSVSSITLPKLLQSGAN